MPVVEKFWLNDPLWFLMDYNNAAKIIPEKHMTFDEQLNAALRFSIYFSLITYVIKRDSKVFFFVIFVAVFTVLMNKHNQNTRSTKKMLLEKLEINQNVTHQGYCTRPTPNNPFMNVSINDYKKFPNRPPACNLQKRSVRKAVNQYFDGELYRNVDDIFHRNASDRQFYTMPSTTIPNGQTDFAEWLYKPEKTCKESSDSCKVRY
jgi:hypothetical protein